MFDAIKYSSAVTGLIIIILAFGVTYTHKKSSKKIKALEKNVSQSHPEISIN